MNLYSKMGNAFFSLTFVGLLILPATLWITGKGPAPTQTWENRNPAPFPDLKQISLKQLPAAIEPWLVDNLPLRTQAVASYLLLWEWHLYTPVRHYFRGKNDSLFALGLIHQHACISVAQDRHLYHIRALTKGRHVWFENSGIAYFFMVPPDKETGRAGDLPKWIAEAQPQRAWPRLKILYEEAQIPFIDLDAVLAQDSVKNYNNKYDFWHWNAYGAAKAFEVAWSRVALKMPIGVPRGVPMVSFVEREKDMGILGVEDVPVLNMPGIESTILMRNALPPTVSIAPNRFAPLIVENPKVPTGTLLLASDSYTHSIEGTFIHSGAGAWPNPLMLQVNKSILLDRASLGYKNMVEIALVLKPDAVLDATCERELHGVDDRVYHPETMLLGEKTLGNLKVPLLPDIAIVQHGNAELQQSPEALSIKATTTDPILILPPVTTTDEGYAVVGGRMVSPAATLAQVFYQAPDGVWKVVSQSINAGENILYFQIVDAPNTTLNIRFDPGQVPGEYTLLPMPFLDLPPKEPQG